MRLGKDSSRPRCVKLPDITREAVMRLATWFVRAPERFSHAEAATLTTAGLTAWRALVVNGGSRQGMWAGARHR